MTIYRVEITRAEGLKLISIYECGSLEAAKKLAHEICESFRHTDIMVFVEVQKYGLDETDGIFKQDGVLSKERVNF